MYKIGTFFIFLGIFLAVLYLFSDLANAPSVGLLISGVIITLIGIWIWNNDRPQPSSKSERFRFFRQTRNKSPKVKDKKNKKRQETYENQEE